MKKDIHPQYHKNAKVKDATSGETFEVGSTQENIDVEISYKSHPFYTGKEQLVDTAGRVDRFKRLIEQKEKASAGRKSKKVKQEERLAKKASRETSPKAVKKTLKEAKASDLEVK